jgi:glycosyltransferase involved in cell wall biosynthesis
LAEKLHEKVQRSGYSEKVQITGHISGEELDNVLGKSNVLLLPSEKEGFPLSFLECAEQGMAAIVTMESAIPYVFEEGKEFLGFRVGNEGELHSKMKTLANNLPLRRSIGESARRAVHRCCTIEAAAPEYLSAYQRVVSHTGHSGSGKLS